MESPCDIYQNVACQNIKSATMNPVAQLEPLPAQKPLAEEDDPWRFGWRYVREVDDDGNET